MKPETRTLIILNILAFALIGLLGCRVVDKTKRERVWRNGAWYDVTDMGRARKE